ncbi:hypothetical protein ABFS83_11G031000 [Erythranthe nasuta]
MEIKKHYALVLLLLYLLIDVQTEARICYSTSKNFHGNCFLWSHIRNCKTICKHEKFVTGRCSLGTCLCLKNCNFGQAQPLPKPSHGGGGGGGGKVGACAGETRHNSTKH